MKKMQFSKETLVWILREVDTSDKMIVELCRRRGINDVTFQARRY